MATQFTLNFSEQFAPDLKNIRKVARSGAFTDNMSLPVHRWYRYSAGFSADWAKAIIMKHLRPAGGMVFDPFVGSGTTLIAAQSCNVLSAGAENHDFVYRIAKAKLSWCNNDQKLLESGLALLHSARSRLSDKPSTQSPLLRKCYDDEALCKLEALKSAHTEQYAHDEITGKLLWLAITAILRECSHAGTAQWQYVLPRKSKVFVQDPFVAFLTKLKMFCSDMHVMQARQASPSAELALCDARTLSAFTHLAGRVNLVITSPPYPNNYDYADATRLEMTFWGEVDGWGDLHAKVRHQLICACSQHSAAERLSLDSLLKDSALTSIRDEITAKCEELAVVRETRGGKKAYHTMIAAYFIDLSRTWQALRTICADGSSVCFVIGDSAPYGVHIPVERWLGQLALAAGFQSFSFEKIRDRNIKWKNRKHRVPLKEGHLWVEG